MSLTTDVNNAHRWGRRRSARASATLAITALVASGLAVVATPQAAQAAPAMVCINTLYLTNSADQSVRALTLTTNNGTTTGTVSGTPAFPIPANVGANANQLGIAPNGTDAYYGTGSAGNTSNVVDYNAASGISTAHPKPSGVANGTVGAVNPKTGLYYYGAYAGSTLSLYVYDPETQVAQPGVVATVDAPNAPGGNGDIAFDKAGRLYLVNASTASGTPATSTYRLYVADGTIPTSGTGTTMTSVELTTGTTQSAANGIAFASDGYLYVGGSTSIQKANPITGASIGSPITLPAGVTSTDLGTCANPSTTEVVSTFPNGKDQPTDSTTITVGGGSYGTPGTAPDFPASTTNPDGTTSTEPGVVLPGETYTVTQTGNGTTNLGNYSTTWTCRDQDGRVISQGTGNTATYTAPTGTDGTSTVCTFANELPPPVAVADTATVVFGTTPIVFAGATNDTPGNGVIQPAQTVFTSPSATNGGKSLTTTEGDWTIGNDGRITFVPAPGYSGTTQPVGYRIVDDNGLTSDSTATATVRSGPSAAPDANSTRQNVAVTVTPLSNDTPGQNADGTAGTIDPSTLRFPASGQPVGATVSNDRRTLTVPNEGQYVIDAATGVTTFTPVSTFYGIAQAVAYTFTDSIGNPAGSTITITVTEVAPVAIADTANTPYGTPVTVDVLDNDTAGPGGDIDPGSVVFTDPTATNGGKRLETDQGVWTVGADGRITFTPAPGYSGTTPPVSYQVTDANGQTATSTVGVTVRPGPSATADDAETDQNVDVTFPILGNDTPGLRADGSAGAFDPDSVRFVVTPALPTGSSVSANGRELTVPGQGVYTFDPSTRQVTFDPERQFSGPATPVTYEVDDQAGNTASATISVTVRPITPIVTGDAVKTPGDTAIILNPLANDSPGASSAPLDPASVVFTDPTATNGGKTLATPDGTWTVRDDGTIRFVPAPGFEGTAGPVEYEVRDTNGTPATGELNVVVGRGALAAPDNGTTAQNQQITVPLLRNDEASDLGNPCDDGETDVPVGCDTGTLLPGSVVFPAGDQPDGAIVSGDGLTIQVPGQGSYTIDPADGSVTFTPLPGFSGTATPVVYSVTDTHGATVTSTVTITVTAVVPVATDDRAQTAFGTPVTVDLLDNDTAGDPLAPLVPGLTVFPATGQPAGVTVSADGKTITIPGQGEFVLDADGNAAFTPAPGYSGTTTAVTYRIEDANGTQREAIVQVTVRPGPVAAADGDATRQGIAVTVSPLGNDTPSRNADDSEGEWDAASVVFPVDGQPAATIVSSDGKTLTVPGQGVYSIAANGDVTFQPTPAFSGTASPVVYAVTDANGNTATSTITIIVTAVTPTAGDDRATTPFGTPVTFDIVGNDEPGDTTVPLVPASAVFEASGVPAGLQAEIRDGGKTLDVAGQGVFTLNADGTVTFTPAAGFSGTTTPVRYTISDANGTTATAALTVTVQPGPVLEDDVERTPQNTPVTVDVLDNDLAGLDADGERGTLDPTSVVFPADGQSVGTVSDGGKTLTVLGQGVYRIDPVTGAITFTPEPQFRGAATPVVYAVTDSLGTTATATLTITVLGVEPVARDDSATTPAGTAVTIDVLANDSGATGVPLDPTSLKLVDGSGALVDRITVPGEGTWTVVDGKLVFTPLPDFRGRTTPVTYSIADANGTRATALATVTVGDLPATGGDIPWLPIGGGLLLLLVGAALLVLRRRRHAA